MLLSILVCFGIAAPKVGAADDTDIIAPIRITLPMPDIPGGVDLRLGLTDSVTMLPDGRIAVIGYTFASSRVYVRIYDPRTGADEIRYAPLSSDFELANRLNSPVAAIGDTLFIYGSRVTLLRAGPRSSVADPVAIHEEDSPEHSNPADPDANVNSLRAVGSIIEDRDSVLVGWWEDVSTNPDADDRCGVGATVARVSSDGRLVWRWQDPRGGFGFPNEMAVLASGTIIVQIDGGGAREDMGTIMNPCVNGSESVVALTPDGNEIARLDLPWGTAVGPLSLSADGNEALATARFDDGPDAILRISLDDNKITLRRVDLSKQILDSRYSGSIVTTLRRGGYRILTDIPSELILDEQANVSDGRVLNTVMGRGCSVQGDRAVICWAGDEVTFLPLH
ncbi:hypothetical protein [Hypericibacter sp.]|uniref:hypothetical protein n=1 Tax=Hypericibacter sp. TaxID=2705401 RepID=UPI003D6D1ED8